MKLFPILIQYFDWEHGGIQSKLLDFQSKPNETAQTIADYVNSSLEKFDLVKKTVAFSGDNCNTMFGGVARSSTNNVFFKLKDVTRVQLIGVGCPAHVLNNCLQHGMDALDIDIQSIVLKIYNYFSIYTVRTESLKDFCNFVEIEYKQMLYHCETRWLSIFPAVERMLEMYPALKSFFLSQSKPPILIKRFFENNFSEMYLLLLQSLMGMFKINVDALQREGTSVIEMQSILQNVKTSLEDRLASKFIPLKLKMMMSQTKEEGYEGECEKFSKQAEELYSSCLCYLNMWVQQYNELSVFNCMSLRDSKCTTWDKFELAVQFVISRGVNINDGKCFDDFCHLQRYVKENEMNSEFSCLLSHEKWAQYFSADNNAANHSELLKLVQFCFSIPAHNGNVERVFSLMQSQWTKERNKMKPESVKGILTVQYNFKDMTCEQFHSHLKRCPELLKKIGSTEKYSWADPK